MLRDPATQGWTKDVARALDRGFNAIVGAADPMTLLTRYQQIAATTQDIVTTDIPQSVVGDFADLALKVKDAGIQSVVFDDSIIRPAYPDFDLMRGLVQQALGTTPSPAPTEADPGPLRLAVGGVFAHRASRQRNAES